MSDLLAMQEAYVAAQSVPPGHFRCDGCRDVFAMGWTQEEAVAEAEEAGFTPEEAERDGGLAVVCDDCWLAMRAAMPDLNARYTS